MKIFLEGILPQILGFSKKLDKLILIVDEPWVIISENDSFMKLIFRQNNTLLVSENGNVSLGKWDLLNKADSLLLEINNSLKLYSHGFLDEAILILKIDGGTDYLILVNQNRIPDLNYVSYIENKYGNPNTQSTKKTSSPLQDKEYIKTDRGVISIEYLSINQVPSIGDKIFVNNLAAPRGKYKISTLFYIHVSNGQIIDTSMF